MITDAESILSVCGMGTYLHISCGTGTLITELLKRSIDAYGIDRSSKNIANINNKIPGRFFVGSLVNYPFKSQTFDTVIVGGELLEFNPHEMVTVLKAIKMITKRNLIIYFTPDELRRVKGNDALGNRLFGKKQEFLLVFVVILVKCW